MSGECTLRFRKQFNSSHHIIIGVTNHLLNLLNLFNMILIDCIEFGNGKRGGQTFGFYQYFPFDGNVQTRLTPQQCWTELIESKWPKIHLRINFLIIPFLSPMCCWNFVFFSYARKYVTKSKYEIYCVVALRYPILNLTPNSTHYGIYVSSFYFILFEMKLFLCRGFDEMILCFCFVSRKSKVEIVCLQINFSFYCNFMRKRITIFKDNCY